VNSFLGNFGRAAVLAQYIFLAAIAAGASGCASYGTGNYSVTIGTKSTQALLVPPGVSTSQNLSIVLPMPWVAKCDGFEIPFAAREGSDEDVRLQPAWGFRSSAHTRVRMASPDRIDPRRLEESINAGLAQSGTCFVEVPEEARSTFRSNLIELVSTLIPRTFTEDLWHNYLFDPDSNEKLVALRPGMRLRLVFSHFYSAANLSELREGWASAGTSSVVYDVVKRGGCTTLSAWRPTIYGSDIADFNSTDLSQVLEMNASSPEPDFVVKNFRLINGSWDFVNPACTGKSGVLVLRYPSLVVGQKDMASKTRIKVLALPMIFAADNYAGAINLSHNANLVDGDSPEGTEARDTLRKSCVDGRCFLISARALPIPEIRISINGALSWVEMGTRIRDVVQADRGTLGAVAYERSGSNSNRSITSPKPRSVEIRRIAPLFRYASLDYRSFEEIGDLILAPDDEVSWK